jgi:two-component system sensor histidine kinase CpxA
MQSLFVKIFGLCVFVLVVSLSAMTYIRLGAFRPTAPNKDAFSALLTVELGEARHAWETGGRGALAATLERMGKETEASEIVFTDAQGADLLTGRDRSELVQRARNRGRFSYSGGDSHSFARISIDGKYWYFLHDSASLFIPQERMRYVYAMLFAALPAWLLTRMMVRPLVKLDQAMSRFGSGDLTVRSDESSKDEFGRLARSFNDMANRICTLLGAERRLLQDISHELRSPLTRVQVSLELARDQGVSPTALDRIQKETDRLSELVGQLLDVTRGEASPDQTRSQAVRLDQVAAEVVDSCNVEARAKNCVVNFKSEGPATVLGSSELLRRAVENVIRNAIRYAPGKTAIEIELIHSLDRELVDQVKLAVRDYGPGVLSNSLPRIFDAFYRIEQDRDRESGGIGLGLAITRRAVELHRGKVEAHNANPGLLVEIHLPACQQKAVAS